MKGKSIYLICSADAGPFKTEETKQKITF